MKVYEIACSTCCSCCSDDNHYRGFYASKDEATARVARFYKGIDNPLCSQYAKYGHYSICEHDAELIDGERIIVEERVYTKKFIAVDLIDGSLKNASYAEEYLRCD